MSSRLVRVARQQVDDGVELLIVHIPNVSYSQNTPRSQQTWPELLSRLMSSNARVLQFQHSLAIENPFPWSQLFEHSFELLKALDKHPELQSATLERFRPLVFITEGLGGLILKKTLVHAHSLQHRHKSLLQSIVGIIIVGVPHVKGTGEDTLKHIETLLRPSLTKVSKRSLSKEQITDQELLSDYYREVNNSLSGGLISGYETVETALASWKLSIRKEIAILVDKEFASIEWPRILEQLLPIDIKLELILQTDQHSKLRNDLADYILKIATAASEMIERTRVEREAREEQERQNPPALHSPVYSLTNSQAPSSPLGISPSPSGYFTEFPPASAPVAMPTRSPTLTASLVHKRSNTNDPALTPSTIPGMLGTSSRSDSSFEVVPEAVASQSVARRIHLPCYIIKPNTKNERFWPQPEAMKAIEDVLCPSEGSSNLGQPPALRTFVLHGMGGIGKTEIATEFVFKHKDEYDAIFFLHAEKRDRLASEVLQIADALGLDETTDIDAARDAVMEWWTYPVKVRSTQRSRYGSFGSSTETAQENPDLAKWLIVFDNADDPELLFKYCWPRNGHGSVLVTSRNPAARNSLYFGKAGYEVAPLSVDDAAAFLTKTTDQGDILSSKEAAKAIAKRLGGLPLAVEQIGAFINLHNMSLHRFWNRYKNDKDLEALQDRRFAEGRGYEHNVAGVFALENLPHESRSVLNIMAFLDPDCVQSRLLTDNLASMTVKSFPKTQIRLDEAIDVLGKSSLVAGDIDYVELRVHRLVQDVARAQMRATGVLESHFDAVVNLIWSDFPRITRGGVGRAQKVDRWQRCDQLFPHISRLREFYEAYDGDKKAFQSQRKLADLLNEAGWYQHERTNPTDTTPVVELAQRICEESEEDYTEQLALIFGTRTWSCALMKQFDAVFRFANERLELEQKLFERSGKVTANLASAYNDKAAAYSMNKLPQKAFALLEESQRLRESLQGFKPEHNFSPYHERGVAYWLQEEYEESERWLLKALRDRVAALGENDRQSVRTGQLFYALGNTIASRSVRNLDPKSLADSAMWHQKALIHYRATVGDNHYRTACARFRMAEHFIRTEQYDLAHDMLKQTIKVFKDRPYYRQEHAHACFLYHELHKLEGNTTAAQAILQQSINSWNEAFPNSKVVGDDLRKQDFVSLCTYDF